MREEEEEKRENAKWKMEKGNRPKVPLRWMTTPCRRKRSCTSPAPSFDIADGRWRPAIIKNHQKSSGIFTGSLLILNKTSKTSEEIKWQRPWSLRNPEMSSTIQPNVKNPSRIFKDRHKCSQESLKIQKILSRIPAGSKKPLKSPRILKNP